MNLSLDEYIQKSAMKPTATGFVSGFNRQQNSQARPQFFDARQKLARKQSTSVSRTLGSGRVVGHPVPSVQQPTTDDVLRQSAPRIERVSDPLHGLALKTKYTDARQRLDMKKLNLQDRNDARMKLLAKRRFSQADPAGKEQQQDVTVTVTKDGQQPVGSGKPNTVAGSTGLTQVGRPLSVNSGGGVLQKTISISQKPSSSATGVSMVGGNICRTITAEPSRHLSNLAFGIEVSGTGDGRHVRREIVNDLYGQQPIQTIVSSRSLPPPSATVLGQNKVSASAAATAAAKTVVSAAAFAASRTGLKTGAKPLRPGFESDSVQPQNSGSPATTTMEPNARLQGFRIVVSNLQSSVSLEDLMELFGDIGPLKNATISKQSGSAYIVFVNARDAIAAYRSYNTRELDGQPMVIKLMFQPTPEQIAERPKSTVELDTQMLHQVLFNTPQTVKQRSAPVTYTVQL